MTRTLTRITLTILFASAPALAVDQTLPEKFGRPKSGYYVHDMRRPQPRVITPGAQNHLPPSDAIVLFDGTRESFDANWVSQKDKSQSKWKVEGDAIVAVKKAGSIQTRKEFGSAQLHVEWSAPTEIKGEGQGRGNSGVFLMGKYEFQVVDSYKNHTYPDGQAGSVYGQYPPLVNAMREPGEWNTYDIIFRRPYFKDGQVTRPATVTIIHNGVVVQANAIIIGQVQHVNLAKYNTHGDVGPIGLQDHGNPVRFRNIWIRPLPDENPEIPTGPHPDKAKREAERAKKRAEEAAKKAAQKKKK